MNRTLALLLQVTVLLLGLAVGCFLLWEPWLEGRNAHATLTQVYFHDPALAFIYLGSLPFFLGLQRAFMALVTLRRTGQLSAATAKSLRIISRCAFAMVGVTLLGVGLVLLWGDPEDRPAGLFLCVMPGAASAIVAFTARRLAVKLSQTLAGRSA